MIGIVVDNIINNPKNYIMFKELNKLSKEYDCYVFANSVSSLPIPHNFAILQQIEALAHKGILIGTSVINGQIVRKSLTPKKKYFYLQYPEWHGIEELKSWQLYPVLYNEEIDILVKSENDYTLMEKMFKKPVGIIDNWNSEDMKRLIENE